MFDVSVGLTAMDVSLCGPFSSQSVLTFAAAEVAVVQMAVPVFTFGPFDQTVPDTGAGASITLCVASIGSGLSSADATAAAPKANSATTATSRGIRVNQRLLSSGLLFTAFPLLAI